MRLGLSLCAFVLLALAPFGAAEAHEMRPAHLQIDEAANGSIHVEWKQPVSAGYTLSIAPSLSSGWLSSPPTAREVTGDALILEWQIDTPHEPLEGQRLVIEGLERTRTDVLVNVAFADGMKMSKIVKPDQPGLVLAKPGRSSLSAAAYMRLGIEHILTGPDHLLFVFALMLLVDNLKRLVGTVTAFTVAHSITLACATLKIVNVPPAPVEAVIALSIVYVAVELIDRRQGRPGLMERAPWAISFLFGLLHGLGFAGALREIGLPEGDVPLALLLFNCGIEVGQLLFIAAILLLLNGARKLTPALSDGLMRLGPYAVGSLASFWLIERTIAFL
jgi:hydrogenase/urease accessory protein HupE